MGVGGGGWGLMGVDGSIYPDPFLLPETDQIAPV